jgi:biopolymer transport protein ExbB
MTRVRYRSLAALVLLVISLTPAAAHAWWNADFKQRTAITLNTGAAGISTSETIANVAVPIRLHSGNFDFIDAKPDGSDLRVLAADDKTPLKFAVERFDGAGELAVLWVQMPLVAPGSDKNLVYVYAGNPTAEPPATSPVVSTGAVLTLRFAQADGMVRDAGGSTLASGNPVPIDTNGLIGPSAQFDGTQVLELPASDPVQAGPGAANSVSLWARPTAIAGVLLEQGALRLTLTDGKAGVQLGALTLAGGTLPPSTWVHLGLTIGAGKVTLYVDGAQAAQANLPAKPVAVVGPIKIAQGFNGSIDELEIATSARNADWMKFTRAAQGADAKLIAAQVQRQDDAEADSGHGGYIGILVKNLTVDAWVVIGILGVMFVIALWVMVTKAFFVLRTDRGNQGFIQAFRAAADVMQAGGAQVHPRSSLARLYDAGLQQLRKRHVGQEGAKSLSGASLNAVRASIDADLVRENHRLNALMVLLTIAISGGPFLGLLGTVVGVMITFAAIAAAGDVNVNAIAPGIAAALLATVAGLGVAIPALFGYNYLASKIKNISSDMQIFVDEFVTRVAENYGER